MKLPYMVSGIGAATIMGVRAVQIGHEHTMQLDERQAGVKLPSQDPFYQPDAGCTSCFCPPQGTLLMMFSRVDRFRHYPEVAEAYACSQRIGQHLAAPVQIDRLQGQSKCDSHDHI